MGCGNPARRCAVDLHQIRDPVRLRPRERDTHAVERADGQYDCEPRRTDTDVRKEHVGAIGRASGRLEESRLQFLQQRRVRRARTRSDVWRGATGARLEHAGPGAAEGTAGATPRATQMHARLRRRALCGRQCRCGAAHNHTDRRRARRRGCRAPGGGAELDPGSGAGRRRSGGRCTAAHKAFATSHSRVDGTWCASRAPCPRSMRSLWHSLCRRTSSMSMRLAGTWAEFPSGTW